jgi:dolichol-phosphate mannosyltransferase
VLKVLIGVPTLNCEKAIIPVIEGLIKISINGISTDILVVDNLSQDKTVHLVNNIKEKFTKNKIHCVKNKQNIGLGGSQTRIFWLANKLNYDYVAIFHGDGQANPLDLERMIKVALDDKTLEAVLGSRFLRESKRYRYSIFRLGYNLILNLVFSMKVKKIIYDMGSGINIYRINKLTSLNIFNLDQGLNFNYELLLNQIYQNHKIKFVSHAWRNDGQKSSVIVWKQTLKLFKLLLRSKKKIYQQCSPNLWTLIEEPGVDFVKKI